MNRCSRLLELISLGKTESIKAATLLKLDMKVLQSLWSAALQGYLTPFRHQRSE
jgi:hypothetical protein